MGPSPIRGTGLPSGAPRRLELVFQLLVLAPQALTLRFGATEIRFELRDPTRLRVDDQLGISRRSRLVALRHASLMPDSRAAYKREMRVSAH
jgi:hypothetical protein